LCISKDKEIFKYLGVLIIKNSEVKAEIKTRIKAGNMWLSFIHQVIKIQCGNM
jgi:hypothetical protein